MDNDYKEIVKNDIPAKLAYKLTKIRKLRNNFMEERNISVFPSVQPNNKRKLPA